MMDLYQILGVERTATVDEIRIAYRKLSMKFHPDRNDGDKYFEEWAKKINEAYEILGNPVKRAAYDSIGQTGQADKNNSRKSYTRTTPEYETLNLVRREYKLYHDARVLYQKALDNHKYLTGRSKPSHFTFAKVCIAIIGMLIGCIGLKNSWGNKSINNVGYLEDTSINTSTIKHEIQTENSRYIDEISELDAAIPEEEIIIPDDANEITEVLIVDARKANFFNSPLNNVSNSKYVVAGDKIFATFSYGDFVYTEFINVDGVQTKGWLRRSRLKPEQQSSEITSVDEDTIMQSSIPAQDSDTIEVLKKKKKGFLKRIFGRKEEP